MNPDPLKNRVLGNPISTDLMRHELGVRAIQGPCHAIRLRRAVHYPPVVRDEFDHQDNP